MTRTNKFWYLVVGLAGLLSLLASLRASAADSKALNSDALNAGAAYKDPHHQGTLSSLNLGFRYSSILENRGVVFYRDFQVDPVLGVFLFNDRVEYLGDSVGFRDFIYQDKIRLRSKLVAISDQPLLPAYASVNQGSANRRDTYEWTNQLEFFLPGYNSKYQSEIDLSFAKDIWVHHGSYLEAQGKYKLFDFKAPLDGPRIEPNLFAAIGWGDAAHNGYFYGPSDTKAGFNNASYGLWFAFPEEADRNYPIIQIKHFEALGDFKNGEYSQGRSDGWLFSVIATAGLL